MPWVNVFSHSKAGPLCDTNGGAVHRPWQGKATAGADVPIPGVPNAALPSLPVPKASW